MPYALSNSRNLQIANSITNAANKDDKGPEINALMELLKIDTKQSNADFIRQFRELKNTHPFVNDLCQRKGFFGSIAYTFRGDDYRAERYKAIIDQLKQGSYIDQDHNNKISYFGTATNLQKSVCEKVEEIKNGYLAKTYTSTENEIYKNDKIVFEELKSFNENVGFKLSKAISTDIQTKDDNDMFIWNEFVKANPEYSSLSPNNQDNVELNIEGTSVQDLKQEVLKKLNLPGNTKLFTEDGNLNESVGKVIKQQLIKQQQQRQAAIKIQSNFRRHIEQRVYHLTKNSFKTIATQINSHLPEDQHISVNEIHLIMSTLKLTNDIALPLFLDKASTNFLHSILIEKSENGYRVLIKPALRNADIHMNKQQGTHKYVKTSGVQINLDTTKNFVDAKRIVTVSKSPQESLKNSQLNKAYGEDLIKDGFTKVAYKDASGKPRIIFKKPYLGENLHSLKRKLSYQQKIEVATQLVNKFNWNIGDIKNNNILWDGAIATFIDTNDMLFTHTTKYDNYQKNYGDFSNNSRKDIAYQQIFSLCCALYEMFNTEPNYQLKGHYWNNQPKPQGLFSQKSTMLQLPFANLVNQTYLHSIEPVSALKALKAEIQSLKTVNQLNA